MKKERIYLSPPYQTGEELSAFQGVLNSNWLAPVGPDLTLFEREICKVTGFKHAVATSSGTAAIHLGLKILGVGVEDPVVTSTMTFVGAVNPILYQGANPVFIDADSRSWNLNVTEVARFLSSSNRKIGAILPTHLYGMPADVMMLEELGKGHKVPVLHDLAECLMGKVNGHRIGELTTRGILSFNGNKLITTSGGGAFVTNVKEEADRALYLATQAKSKVVGYHHEEIGYNYRMSNVLAALGTAQFQNIEERVKKKRQIFETYQSELAPFGFEFQRELEGITSDRWLTCVLMKDDMKISIEETVFQFDRDNIEVRPLWKPMHLQPIYKELERVGEETAERLHRRGVCLPSGCGLSEAQQDFVIKKLKSLAQ